MWFTALFNTVGQMFSSGQREDQSVASFTKALQDKLESQRNTILIGIGVVAAAGIGAYFLLRKK